MSEPAAVFYGLIVVNRIVVGVQNWAVIVHKIVGIVALPRWWNDYLLKMTRGGERKEISQRNVQRLRPVVGSEEVCKLVLRINLRWYSRSCSRPDSGMGCCLRS